LILHVWKEGRTIAALFFVCAGIDQAELIDPWQMTITPIVSSAHLIAIALILLCTEDSIWNCLWLRFW